MTDSSQALGSEGSRIQESKTAGRQGFPVWRCANGHVNDMLRGGCHECGESRPCQNCGGRPARLYPNGMWCDRCPVVAPDGFRASQDVSPAVVGVREVRREPYEAYRPAEGEGVPLGIKTLRAWCEKQELEHDVVVGDRGDERSVVMKVQTPYGQVFVAYEFKGFEASVAVASVGPWVPGAWTALGSHDFLVWKIRVKRNGGFAKALGPMIAGKGNLRDAKRALNMEVKELAERKPREYKPRAKPAEAKEGLR